MSKGADAEVPLRVVPLFPLPTVVLFPCAILPLHIFEERYKEMTADALARDRRVAMALLCAGWERDYYARPAIEPVVCIGIILEAEKLADGKYNLLLQGQRRARIVRELKGQPYRVAEVEPLAEQTIMEIDLLNQRHRLLEMFSGGLMHHPVGRQFRQILSSPMATTDVADLIAFSFLEDVRLKQSLLEDADVERRVDRIVAAMEAMQQKLESDGRRAHENPSMN